MGQTLMRAVVYEYSVMGVTMLFGLATLLLSIWVTMIRKANRHLRRSSDKSDGCPNA